MNELFRKFSQSTSIAAGSAAAFIIASAAIVVWALSGPLFAFSTTWQLVINTSTTIVTFLMVFLIQNTQNRDSKALHLKLDELLRAVHGARTGLVGLEALSDEELEHLHKQLEGVSKAHADAVTEPIADDIEEEKDDGSRVATAASSKSNPSTNGRRSERVPD